MDRQGSAMTIWQADDGRRRVLGEWASQSGGVLARVTMMMGHELVRSYP